MQKRSEQKPKTIKPAAEPGLKAEPLPAAAQPERDLLRAKIYYFSPEQQEIGRAHV